MGGQANKSKPVKKDSASVPVPDRASLVTDFAKAHRPNVTLSLEGQMVLDRRWPRPKDTKDKEKKTEGKGEE